MKKIIENQEESIEFYSSILSLNQYLKFKNYHFITVSPVTHTIWLKKNKELTATSLSDVFGWGFPFPQEFLEPFLFSLLSSAQLIYPFGNLWKSEIRVSTLGNDLFIHSAFPTTHIDSVFFGPDTYRFINCVNDHLSRCAPFIKRAIEVCCGSSPAAITIARQCPAAHVHAIDINEKALRYSAANARTADVQIETINNNLFNNFQLHFDFIAANPPFMMDGKKRAYRDGGEMFGAELALKIVAESLDRLAVGGTLLLYTGTCIVMGEDIFYKYVKTILSAHSTIEWSYREIDPDIFSDELLLGGYEEVERIAAVVLQVYKKSDRHS